ncbi:hypothetical protein BD560DRAFT_382294 [Blakeslea trispora]|nr:hypothetical protein BD560DRAFT_382294 [Blakeslea trispora]
MELTNLNLRKYWQETDPKEYSIANYMKSYLQEHPTCTKAKAHADFNHDLDALLNIYKGSTNEEIFKKLQKQLKHAHKDKELQELWQMESRKRKPSSCSELNKSQTEAFEQAYRALEEDKKWKLKDGVYVEDVLYSYAINLDHESAAHSFILDLEDAEVKKCFSNRQWEEISQVKTEEAASFSEKAIRYLEKIAACNDFRSKYTAIKQEQFDPFEEEDEEWLQRCLLEFHAMYRENVIKRIADRGSEEDLIVRLWHFFDSCFDSLDIETRRGEVGFLATKINNETTAVSISQVQRATKPDLILTKDALEFGIGENGRFTGSACSNKESNEKMLKNPKTMKNMMNVLVKQIKNKKQLIRELQIIGFTHFRKS